MAKRSTTADDDNERLEEELPRILTAPLEGTARVFEGASRFGLEATLWPFRVLPGSARKLVARGLRAGAAASAMIPHALTRAVNESADSLREDSEEE